MINISAWTEKFLHRATETFGNRIWFVGLQGSYGRGEATETSDIDIVLILDELSAKDISIYNEMLDTMPNREQFAVFYLEKVNLLTGNRRIYSSFITIPSLF